MSSPRERRGSMTIYLGTTAISVRLKIPCATSPPGLEHPMRKRSMRLRCCSTRHRRARVTWERCSPLSSQLSPFSLPPSR